MIGGILTLNTQKYTMALSESSLNKIADALAPEVINYRDSEEFSQRYFDFMLELVSETIATRLGPLDPDVFGELSLKVMSRIMFRTPR